MTTVRYRLITKHGHPNAHARGQIFEHIFVMSEMLGRPLTNLEVVHHVDEDKGNNHPDNLQLFASQAEHLTHHKHLRAMQECGNPNYQKCSFCKTYDAPENMALQCSGGYVHKTCKALYDAEATIKRRLTPEGKAYSNAASTKTRSTLEGRAKANASSAAFRAKKKLLNSQ